MCLPLHKSTVKSVVASFIVQYNIIVNIHLSKLMNNYIKQHNIGSCSTDTLSIKYIQYSEYIQYSPVQQ